MAKKQRDPVRESYWRNVLEHQRTSGLNVRAFCVRDGLAESSFHFWRRTIRLRDADGSRDNGSRDMVPSRATPPLAIPRVVGRESVGRGRVGETAGRGTLAASEASATTRESAATRQSPARQAAFVPVVTLPARPEQAGSLSLPAGSRSPSPAPGPTDPAAAEPGITIDLRGGRVLRLPAAMPIARVAELVRALEANVAIAQGDASTATGRSAEVAL